MVETSGFENRHTERYREFESLPLRKIVRSRTNFEGNATTRGDLVMLAKKPQGVQIL